MAVDLRQVAQRSGVSVSTASRALNGSNRVSAGTAALRTLADHSAAGVIVVGSGSGATGELRALGLPTVHLARRPPEPPAVGALLRLPARRRPTALVIANHEASYGALPALREHAVAIPAGLSVICYEDSPLARWWHPAITVIDNNARQMGELAARLLLERLDATAAEPGSDRTDYGEIRVGTRLIERDSCRAL
jgi:DNA-binding LacI/PurR family transcriptional regulator